MRNEESGAGVAGSESTPDRALIIGKAQTVGRFLHCFDDQRWEWSDEVQRIHGYRPGEMPNPTTDLVLSHKHPDDFAYVTAVLEESRRTRSAFSTQHRMIDKQGNIHRVNVVGDLLRDDDGSVIGTQGFYIDASSAEAAFQDKVSEGVAGVIEQRAVIEQAKGMLGVVYGLEDSAAFGLLTWLSQRTNVKVRKLAMRLVAKFREMSGPILPERSAYNNALMTLDRQSPH